MAAQTYYSPFIPAFTSNGVPEPGALLNFYLTGTTTRTPIYSDAGLSIELTNPVTAQGNGKYPTIYLDDSISYRVVQTDSDGAPLGDAIDPYVPGTALKGDPGGNVMATGTFAGLQLLAVPVGANAVHTSGVTTDGDGGAARYVYDAAVNSAYVTAHPYSSTLDASGRGFRLSEPSPNSLQYGAIPDGSTDHVARLLAMIAENAGKGVTIKGGTSGTALKTGRLLLGATHANTEIAVEGYVKASGTSIFYIGHDAPNIRLKGRNATLDHTSSTGSSCIYLSGAIEPEIDNFTIIGNPSTGGSRADCIYIGGGDLTGTQPSEKVRILRCDLSNAGRNNISIVEAHGCEIAWCKIHGTVTGATPGDGVEVEANRYNTSGLSTTSAIKIHDNDIYGNAVSGLAVIFGDDVEEWNNRFWDNVQADYNVGAGGAQFNVGIARDDLDIMGISAWNIATGEATISATAAANLRVGDMATLSVRGAGVKPSTLSASHYVVYSVSATNTVVLASLPFTPVTTLADAGSGTLSTNAETSEQYLRIYRRGQASRLRHIHNQHLPNTVAMGKERILIGLAYDVVAEDNRVWQDTVRAISSIFASDCVTRRNEVLGNASATLEGILFSSSTRCTSDGDRVRDVVGKGISFASCFRAINLNPDIWNCGDATHRSVDFDTCYNVKLAGGRAKGSAKRGTIGGVRFNSCTGSCEIDTFDATGAQTSTTDCYSFVSTTVKFKRAINFDGTYLGQATSVKDFGSLATNAAGTFTGITVPGIATGDFLTVSCSISPAGLHLFAYGTAANTATLVGQNVAGTNPLDLASATFTLTLAGAV